MKRIFFSLQALVILLGAAGCHDSLLNMQPESILTNDQFFQTSSDMNRAVIGIYNALQTRRMTDYIVMEAPSDNIYMAGITPVLGAPDIDGLTVSPDNPQLDIFWLANYKGIFRANQVLKFIDRPVDYAGTAKDQYIGEAKFLRAQFYFDLVRTFGGVPVVTTALSIEEARGQRRNSVDEVYALIIDDLKDAVAKLPAPGAMQKGRTSKGAATALLGKVYLYRKDYPNAKDMLGKAVTDFGYDLTPEFSTLWNSATEDNSEIVFAMKYVESLNSQTYSSAFIPNGGVFGLVDRGTEKILPSWSLNKLFVAGDKRKANTINDTLITPTTPGTKTFYPYGVKFAAKHLLDNSGQDIPMMRFADVLLLQAEALYNSNDKAGALIALNRVRQRAFGDASHNYTAADIAAPNDFLDKLLLERQLELAFEGERWFDLVRTGKFLTVMTKEERLYVPANNAAQTVTLAPQDYMAVFPIPQPQIDQYAAGVLEQNDGYNK
ncbi:RagB/SusD family nutrient uptake outer membrane protein [Chitinophaga sp.]|uniref:RagB/SusD family nutrient uptake outer membrane protein n=1 Tax=Chitinophaga sp. TaxID=1869181 RepID=UPI002626EB76|nr:RagB/SusD family nutrient uptake outer membrane protein [uncultured Chitinophaga sp.]